MERLTTDRYPLLQYSDSLRHNAVNGDGLRSIFEADGRLGFALMEDF